MAGTLALTKAELRRLMHNKRYFIFTVGFPVILYLLIGRQVSAQAYGIAFGAYYMIAMATFGAFSGALNGNAQRISQEKKDGWIRQLRLTPLPANAYVVTKILVSLATTVPAIVIVLLLGRFYGNVHLPAWQWPVIAVTVWFGSTIFAALAVAVGYRFPPDQVQPITLIVYFFFAILGGLWFPLSGFLAKIGKFTPTYEAVKIGTDVIGNTGVYVKKGSFYYFFRSKQQLMVAALEQRWQQAEAKLLAAAFAADVPPLRRIDRLFELAANLEEDAQDVKGAGAQLDFGPLAKEPRTGEIDRGDRPVRGRTGIGDALQVGVETDELAPRQVVGHRFALRHETDHPVDRRVAEGRTAGDADHAG
jgi:ABC-2 type transport system permease protein